MNITIIGSGYVGLVSGTCFPKDVNALLSFSKKHDIELNTIKGGWKTNLKVRQEKDWEEKEGRSVSFKKTK